MTLAELWHIYVQFMWDEGYVSDLQHLLRTNGVTSIIDCAGGIGFPAVALRKNGWDVTYSDGSRQMAEFFERRLLQENVDIPLHVSNWVDLSTRIDRRFDAVLCRGNSLVYVDSWGENRMREGTLANIRAALREFFLVLRPGGLLYVDIINRNEYDQLHYPVREDYGIKFIDGHEVKLKWEMFHDYAARRRTWNAIVSVDSVEQRFQYLSYLLRHEELIQLLQEVGFERVCEAGVPGEKNYNVFLAYR